MAESQSYFRATRHPWPCLLFLLPLLAAYEGGVVWLGGAQPDSLRNGADAWLRWALETFGLNQLYLVPVLLAAGFLIWSLLRRDDRPQDLLGIVSGMALESVFLALGLWALGRAAAPLLVSLDLTHGLPPRQQANVGQVITFVGAGIYEEALFRLVLFTALDRLLRAGRAPGLVAVGFATLTSAACFSAAHHIGPFGEAFDTPVFLFRLLAGTYFALVFRLRGFGIAVGAHACYDVLVGVAVG
jgi:membrane protease YdiL (CAAX protease family)